MSLVIVKRSKEVSNTSGKDRTEKLKGNKWGLNIGQSKCEFVCSVYDSIEL